MLTLSPRLSTNAGAWHGCQHQQKSTTEGVVCCVDFCQRLLLTFITSFMTFIRQMAAHIQHLGPKNLFSTTRVKYIFTKIIGQLWFYLCRHLCQNLLKTATILKLCSLIFLCDTIHELFNRFVHVQ